MNPTTLATSAKVRSVFRATVVEGLAAPLSALSSGRPGTAAGDAHSAGLLGSTRDTHASESTSPQGLQTCTVNMEAGGEATELVCRYK